MTTTPTTITKLTSVPENTVSFRELTAADADSIMQLFERLSDQDRFFRFLRATPVYSADMVRLLTNMNGQSHVAVGAFSAGRLVGIGRYIRFTADPGIAELAITVCPDERRRGIAERLLDWLDIKAAQDGVVDFEAYVHPQNRPAIKLFAARGFKFRFEDGASHGVRPVRGAGILAAA